MGLISPRVFYLSLTATVMPSNATNQTIVWSVQNAGTTGATVSDNRLNTTAAGTVTIAATITNGTAIDTNYTQNFTITVALSGNGITEANLSGLIIYPNPTTGELHVTRDNRDEMEIYDVMGRKQCHASRVTKPARP